MRVEQTFIAARGLPVGSGRSPAESFEFEEYALDRFGAGRGLAQLQQPRHLMYMP